MSESQYFYMFQEPINRVKYAYVGLCVKYASGKKFLSFQNSTSETKKKTLTVSVFLSTLQLTTLLLKYFRLRLHSYTLGAVPVFQTIRC